MRDADAVVRDDGEPKTGAVRTSPRRGMTLRRTSFGLASRRRIRSLHCAAVSASGEIELPQLAAKFAPKYEIVSVLGAGGMGIVLDALHRGLDQRVAIKVLDPKKATDPRAATRFEREARLAARLRVPNVVRILDVDRTADGTPYIVMERLVGHDLATELDRRGSLPIERALALLQEICVGVGEGHRLGIVHRDLKPSNVFLAQEAGAEVVKILDFGIAREVDEGTSATTTGPIGTPRYMSPEQLRGERVDARADVWALGVIAFELVTGEAPFGSGGASTLAAILVNPAPPLDRGRSGVPRALAELVAAALDKDPARRPRDASAFACVLSSIGKAAAPISTAPETRPVDTRPLAHATTEDALVGGARTGVEPRRRRALWLGIALVGSAVTAATFAARFREISPSEAQPSAPSAIASTTVTTGPVTNAPAVVETAPHRSESVASALALPSSTSAGAVRAPVKPRATSSSAPALPPPSPPIQAEPAATSPPLHL
jgi:serine/threonine-protein kinase